MQQDVRPKLLAMREVLESLDESRRQNSEVVELDQSRTGRLSRIDALQLQAMAREGQARSKLELARIDAALERLDRGTFGDCLECGEAIANARLVANPTVTLCIVCARAREGRN